MSGIATGTALAIAAGVGAGGSIGGALIESNAADNAASTQTSAAEQNAQLEAGLGQEQLGYEAGQYGNTLATETPLLESGYNNLATLNYLLGEGSTTGAMPGIDTPSQALSIPGVSGTATVPGLSIPGAQANTNEGAYGSLLSPYPGGSFTAPTSAQAEQAPGYQFALQQGEGAQQASAAAQGSLLTGGTQTALDQYAQNLANTNYQSVYNNALNAYNTNYNTWANQQANTYNRLASGAGLAPTTAQLLSTAGTNSAQQVASTLGQTGSQVAQQNTNAAAATASGYIGSANAWGGALGSSTQTLSQMAMLNSLLNGNSNDGLPGTPTNVPGVNVAYS